MVPTVTLTSMLDEPSSGSNTSRYWPRGIRRHRIGLVQFLGDHAGEQAAPLAAAHHDLVRQHVELLLRPRPGRCVPPCSPRWPPSAPLAVIAEIAFTAAATSTSSAPRSWALGDAVQLLDEELRQRRASEVHGVSDSLLMVLDGRGLEHPAGADVRRRDRRQVLRREDAVALGEQPARLAQPRAVERVAHAARVGEMRLADARAQVLARRPRAPPASKR